MKEIRKSITCLQSNLNQLLSEEGATGCKTSGAYSLSILLDKEIVKYYKSLNRSKYS